jgi:hypothetical protein
MASNTFQGVIVAADRLTSSANGNPRFRVTFRYYDDSGKIDTLVFLTSSDAACSYDVENVLRSGEEVVIGLTRASRIETISRLDSDARIA